MNLTSSPSASLTGIGVGWPADAAPWRDRAPLNRKEGSTVEETDKKKTRKVWWARRSTWGVVAAVTILPSLALGMTVGSAQAQPGSRICGAYWEGTNNRGDKVRYVQVREVPKTDKVVCAKARDDLDNYPADRTDWKVGESQAIDMWTCERFSKHINFKMGRDACLNMKRTDSALGTETDYNISVAPI
jgi:hypothetical protein